MRKDWWVPLTGVAFVVVSLISFAVAGEPPDADSPVPEIVEHYVDKDSSVMIGAALAGIAATLLVFFAGYLSSALRRAEGEGGMLSRVVLAGAVILAVGIAIDATILFALAEAADKVDPSAVQALQALWDNDFMPLAVGLQVFMIASGISILLHGVFPKWLGWVAILFGILAATPAGPIGFVGAALWVIVISVLSTTRLRSGAA